jgi:hypothetical protein
MITPSKSSHVQPNLAKIKNKDATINGAGCYLISGLVELEAIERCFALSNGCAKDGHLDSSKERKKKSSRQTSVPALTFQRSTRPIPSTLANTAG